LSGYGHDSAQAGTIATRSFNRIKSLAGGRDADDAVLDLFIADHRDFDPAMVEEVDMAARAITGTFLIENGQLRCCGG
jgi:hypothetical protein